MLDLQYIYRFGHFALVEEGCECNDVLAISGCRDNQTSADAYINKQYSGALTWALLKVLKNIKKVPTTWFSLLTVVQHYLVNGGYSQVPVLSVGDEVVAKMNVDL